MRRLYEEEWLTDLEISLRLNLSEHQVGRLRRRYGISTIRRIDRNAVSPTSKQIEVLTGCLLGDGGLTKTVKNCRGECTKCESMFECSHGPKQHDYLKWKYEIFHTWCHDAPKPIENHKLRMRSFSSSYFSELRREWYPKGTKIVPDSIRGCLTPLALAVWYMDDGHLADTGATRFCTCAFSNQDCEKLSSWLEADFQISANLRTYGGYNYLYIPAVSQSVFFEIIKPFLLDSFNYKVKKCRIFSMDSLHI